MPKKKKKTFKCCGQKPQSSSDNSLERYKSAKSSISSSSNQELERFLSAKDKFGSDSTKFSSSESVSSNRSNRSNRSNGSNRSNRSNRSKRSSSNRVEIPGFNNKKYSEEAKPPMKFVHGISMRDFALIEKDNRLKFHFQLDGYNKKSFILKLLSPFLDNLRKIPRINVIESGNNVICEIDNMDYDINQTTENEYEISIKDKDLIVLNKLFSTFGTSIPEKGAISKLLGGRTGPDSIFVKSLIYDANNNKINMIIEWSGRDSLFELEEKPIHSGQKKKGKKSNKKTKGRKSRDRKKKTIRR